MISYNPVSERILVVRLAMRRVNVTCNIDQGVCANNYTLRRGVRHFLRPAADVVVYICRHLYTMVESSR